MDFYKELLDISVKNETFEHEVQSATWYINKIKAMVDIELPARIQNTATFKSDIISAEPRMQYLLIALAFGYIDLLDYIKLHHVLDWSYNEHAALYWAMIFGYIEEAKQMMMWADFTLPVRNFPKMFAHLSTWHYLIDTLLEKTQFNIYYNKGELLKECIEADNFELLRRLAEYHKHRVEHSMDTAISNVVIAETLVELTEQLCDKPSSGYCAIM